MKLATALEFQRRIGEFQHHAQFEPVNITRHGRRELVLMSADHYDWLVAAAKCSHRTDHTAGVVLEAVRSAQMDPECGDITEEQLADWIAARSAAQR